MSERVKISELNIGDLIQYDDNNQTFMWLGNTGIVCGVNKDLPAEHAGNIFLDQNLTLLRVQKGTMTLNKENA